MKYINISIALLALSCVCVFAQIPIKIKQVESKEQVKIGYNVTKDCIWGVQIPFEFKVIFKTNDSLWISQVFNYANGKFADNIWSSVPYKIKIGGQYVFSDYRYPQQPDTCYYRVLSRYFLNMNNTMQDSLSQYTKRKKAEDVTSLDVGTLSEFKKKHPKIIERILKNDSIGFDIRKMPREFMNFIAVPVEY